MPLAADQALTHCELLGPLGAGMGEAWRAREVAIQRLPEHVAGDEERLERFEREVKTLVSPNHRSVAGIHGRERSASAWQALLAVAVALVIALPSAACRTPVGVHRTGFEPNFLERRASVLDQQGLSTASLQLLSFTGLREVHLVDPEQALERMEAIVFTERRRRPFAALAELTHARAKATGDRGRYLLSALYAYSYLFSTELEPAADPYDPLFRLACDLYNRSLAQALLDDSGELDLADRVLQTPRGPFALSELRPGFPWGREEFSRFLPADAYSVRGLRSRVRLSGLGVPLIAVRNQTSVEDPLRRHLAPNLKLAATALLRPEGGVEALKSGRLSGSLELYFPTDIESVELAGRRVPLEADLTAPLAYSLQDSPVWDFSLKGFFGGGDELAATGVYMTQPYQRGKIPVLLVHGTASNPAQWSETINDLMLDPHLRRRYQLWVGLYHTGNPILYSAFGIRTALAEVVAKLDPGGTDEGLANLVVVGHSQGGLVARLLVSSSGDDFWGLVSDEPFADYPLSPEARQILAGSVFFEPMPFISRVVFISTPHRGSYLAASPIGRFFQGLVEVPSGLKRTLKQLGRTDRLPQELREGVPTSVENMYPDSRFVGVLQGLPFAPGVHLHSIVAVKGKGPPEKGNDGVVAYASAHLEQAESELVVRHGHSCQNEPAVVLELRRILLEHLRAPAPQDPEEAGPVE